MGLYVVFTSLAIYGFEIKATDFTKERAMLPLELFLCEANKGRTPHFLHSYVRDEATPSLLECRRWEFLEGLYIVGIQQSFCLFANPARSNGFVLAHRLLGERSANDTGKVLVNRSRTSRGWNLRRPSLPTRPFAAQHGLQQLSPELCEHQGLFRTPRSVRDVPSLHELSIK